MDSVKLQRHSLDSSNAHDRAVYLERENGVLRAELAVLRAHPHPDVAPQSHPAVTQAQQLTLSLRRLSDQLSLTEAALLERTTELAHATGEASKAKAAAEAAYELAARTRGREEAGKLREAELEWKVKAAEEAAKMSDLVVSEYADLVRSLKAEHPHEKLVDGLAEGKLGLQRLLSECSADTARIQKELLEAQGALAVAESQRDAENSYTEKCRVELAQAQFVLQQLKIDDNAAAKMVSRYMKFSQNSTDTLSDALTALKTRHAATTSTLSSQLLSLGSQLQTSETQTETLRRALDELGGELAKEAFGRRREVALRIRMVNREERIRTELERWVLKAEEATRRNDHGDANVGQMVSGARAVLEGTLGGADGEVGRVVVAEHAVRELTMELEVEMARRLELERIVAAEAAVINGDVAQHGHHTDTSKALPEPPVVSDDEVMPAKDLPIIVAEAAPPPTVAPTAPSTSHLPTIFVEEVPSPTATPTATSTSDLSATLVVEDVLPPSSLPILDESPSSIQLEPPTPSSDSSFALGGFLREEEPPASSSPLSLPGAFYDGNKDDDIPYATPSEPPISSSNGQSISSNNTEPNLTDISPDSLSLPAELSSTPVPNGTSHQPEHSSTDISLELDSHPVESLPSALPSEAEVSHQQNLIPIDGDTSTFETVTLMAQIKILRHVEAPSISEPVDKAPAVSEVDSDPEKGQADVDHALLDGHAHHISTTIQDNATPGPKHQPTSSQALFTVPEHNPEPELERLSLQESPATTSRSKPPTPAPITVDLEIPKSPSHPLLVELERAKHRYDALQRSLRDCHLALESLTASIGLQSTMLASGRVPAEALRVAVERLNDYTEDARVELEIRVADEALVGRGFETLLSVPGALATSTPYPSSQNSDRYEDDDHDQDAITHSDVERQLRAFVDGSDAGAGKAMRGISRKLEDIEHDIAVLKRAVHDEDEAVFSPSPATSNDTGGGWTSWIRSSPSSPASPPPPLTSASASIPAPTFGSIMTSPRLRHSPSLNFPGRRAADPLASLGLKVPMPSYIHHMASSPPAVQPRSRTLSTMYMLGLGARRVSGPGSLTPSPRPSPKKSLPVLGLGGMEGEIDAEQTDDSDIE